MTTKLTLAAPHYTQPGTTEYRVQTIQMTRGFVMQLVNGVNTLVQYPQNSRMTVVLIDSNGNNFIAEWGGQEAETLIRQLNKANFTVKHMEQHAMEKAQIKIPALAGTFAEEPDV